MRAGVFWRALAAGFLAASVTHSSADEASTWAALRRGGLVALVRHADAPGVGDPAGFKLDNCATQRNLSERGRADARALGNRFRAERVAIGQVLSSPWCRCLDTATLMELGPVRAEPTLANAFILDDRREVLTEGARSLIAGWRGPGTLLLVSHGENIQALTGRSVASGETLVVAGQPEHALRVVGSLAPAKASP